MDSSLNLKKNFFSWKTLISFVLAFAIIYLLISRMDTARVITIVGNADISLYALGFIFYYMAFPLRGARFKIMLNNSGCAAPVADLTRIILISWFANCVVPAKLGDVFRAFLVKNKFCHPLVNTVGTVFSERVFDLFILYLLIGISGRMAFKGVIPTSIMTVLEAGFIMLSVLLAVLIFMRFYSSRLIQRLPQKVKNLYEMFLSGAMSSFKRNWEIAGLTTLIWFLEGLSFFMVTRAIDINLPLVTVLFVGLMSALLTALPITPAGLGIVETAKVGMLMFFNIDSNVALSAALIDRVINYWSLLLFGFLLYMSADDRLTKEAEINESDDCHSYIQ